MLSRTFTGLSNVTLDPLSGLGPKLRYRLRIKKDGDPYSHGLSGWGRDALVGQHSGFLSTTSPGNLVKRLLSGARCHAVTNRDSRFDDLGPQRDRRFESEDGPSAAAIFPIGLKTSRFICCHHVHYPETLRYSDIGAVKRKRLPSYIRKRRRTSARTPLST